MALCSLFLQVFTFRPIFNDEVLNVIFGGVIWGASIVIALRGNASTGGTDMVDSAPYSPDKRLPRLCFQSVSSNRCPA